MRPGFSRRALILAPAAVLAGVLLFAPAAFAGVLLPERGGSPNADDISTLYTITLAIGAVIFLLVEGTLIWSLVKFRHRRGAPAPAQVRGNTPLELGWTLGAAFIVLVIAVVTFVYLDDIRNPPASDANGLQRAAGVAYAAVDQPDPPEGEALEIEVNSQQYVFRYDYPGAGPNEEGQLFSYHELVVPVNTTVLLKVTSQDVAHAWWAPKLGGKVDALPGHINETWFKVKEPGFYGGACTELCGDGHADMRAVVRALPVDEYEAWADQTRRDIAQAQAELAEQRENREARERELEFRQ